MFLRIFKRNARNVDKVMSEGEQEALKEDLGHANVEGYDEVERYPLVYPWAYAVILEDRRSKAKLYYVNEVPLSSVERGVAEYIYRYYVDPRGALEELGVGGVSGG